MLTIVGLNHGGGHNMGSAVVPPTIMDAMTDNMRWDGFFRCSPPSESIGSWWMLGEA